MTPEEFAEHAQWNQLYRTGAPILFPESLIKRLPLWKRIGYSLRFKFWKAKAWVRKIMGWIR